MSGRSPRGKAAAPAPAQPPVPVQLTHLVPVRVVSVHGDFFDTELHQDAPMRILQRAAEDCFKVRPELQLLTHNRQQINPNLSLRRNGCLLLKGDPYVKILLDIKKGKTLNIVCQMPPHEPVPLACEAAGTVWEVKKKFCTALSKAEVTPQRIRLLWRYWELNDKATLDYYHLPTNAKLSVMRKRGFVATSQPQRSRRAAGFAVVEAGGGFGATAVEAKTASPHPPAAGIEKMQERTMAGPAVSISPWPALPRQFGHAVIPLDPAVGDLAARSLANEAGPRPEKGAELASIASASGMLEDTQRKQELASLECRVATTDDDRAGYELLEESYRATLGRVAELEATMGRFQHLLKKTLALM
ncbi:hypothetical protein TraAM80_06632 [Trypanosoma rangeli]|uniref:Ubiquitin-like domain-containing protein n=1 Tax=Trypanosoma rangeli TaxID=5698 RepID=A0A422N975_TRYRA|nr:uncharacterized protein TraAM80_06632 [Trypanosoma rangeli]RNF02017.1 hypothetical protein TraAM80_06632 [Trypanosoma rangeli]|eukprot:RNF02017.1 hypothetical protein TraAM80_06632 [Trypanosoma rangeli]